MILNRKFEDMWHPYLGPVRVKTYDPLPHSKREGLSAIGKLGPMTLLGADYAMPTISGFRWKLATGYLATAT